ncbi:hypothetical protein ACIQAA_27495 [Neobacillus sp. NPDC093182]|uniref:hypothetical protein n=1 Tax=Neobacillus sp. NPDC093182 TaxID=3364297 RepID=UPI00382E5355
MNQGQSSSNLVNTWKDAVKKHIATLQNYLLVLNNKQVDCENELHQLVTNRSINFSERKTRTLELMEEQERLKQLIDDLERIIITDKGDTE